MNGTEAKIFFISPATARRVVGIGAVDLGQQRRQHRRSGRHLDHLERLVPSGSLSTLRRSRRSSAMAWLVRCALAARREIDLQFAQFGRFAQIIMAHQPVEIERRGVPA